ncbi:hypothetical protein [Pseudoalteromonas sp.]|uniref:hypothetical protein n=1 Tax=Pseudoalteromonas sp. TaxID=53249 RepID=UPI0030810FE4
MQWLSSIELKGEFVTLEPLNKTHTEGLKQAVLDGESWKLWFHRLTLWQGMSKKLLKQEQRVI